MSKKIEIDKGDLRRELWEALNNSDVQLSYDELIDRTVGHFFPKETLDDYEKGNERGEAFGMWAEVWYPQHREHRLRIIVSPNWDWFNNSMRGNCLVMQPGAPGTEEVGCNRVTPRFDLQRAWTTEGIPAEEA